MGARSSGAGLKVQVQLLNHKGETQGTEAFSSVHDKHRLRGYNYFLITVPNHGPFAVVKNSEDLRADRSKSEY